MPEPRTSHTRATRVLHGMLDASHDGLLALDEHGTITDANASAATILGHEQDRLLGKPLAAMLDLPDRRELRGTLLRLPQPDAVGIDVHIRGEEWHLSLRAIPRMTPRTVVASLSRQRATRVQVRLPTVQRHLLRFGLATVAYDRERRLVFANAPARRLFGAALRRGDEFSGGPFPELLPLVERLTRIAVPLQPTVLELAGGRALRVHGLAATAADPAVLFLEDVSDELQYDRVMREFLRNAAHQLRTPLAGITAAIETLQAGAKDSPADRERFLGHLATHAERLSRIARGLLLLARAETGEPIPIDFVELEPLVEQIVGAVEPRRDVSIRASCTPNVAALASPDLLREALAALVENAVEHTYEGEIEVRAAAADGKVLISVTDSGAGILPEFQDRIFEPFFRVTQSGEGYGLGLAIAARAVRAMHGAIGVLSVLGTGTTFTVTLQSATVTR